MRVLLTLALFLGASQPLRAAEALMLWTDKNISPAVLTELTHGQDLAMSQRFDEAEALIRGAMVQAPEHPLGQVFLTATLLAKVQEDFRGGRGKVPSSFFEEADTLIRMAEAQKKAFPESPYPRFYLGAGYGVRGLARLYARSYLASYRDGKRGVAELKEVVAIAPDLYDVYMGLGQFEYYCATLGGVLQFLLALPGDADKGLAMLKTCEDHGSYAAWPCKAYRAKLILADRKDYAAVEPELAALVARYPGNYDFAKAVFKGLEAGVNTAALRRSADEILRRLRQGWQPPAHAGIDAGACKLILAKAYLAAEQAAQAKPLLAELSALSGTAQAREAAALLGKH